MRADYRVQISEANVRLWQILLQKSPRGCCRIEMRNNRIAMTGFLNQNCEFTPDLESMLLARTLKILLQHYRHQPAVRGSAAGGMQLRVNWTERHGRTATGW